MTKVDELGDDKLEILEELSKELEKIDDKVKSIQESRRKTDLRRQETESPVAFVLNRFLFNSSIHNSSFEMLERIIDQLKKYQSVEKIKNRETLYKLVKSELNSALAKNQLSEYQRIKFGEKCTEIDIIFEQKDLVLRIVNSIRNHQLSTRKPNEKNAAKTQGTDMTIKNLENLLRKANHYFYLKNTESIEEVVIVEAEHKTTTKEDLQPQINRQSDNNSHLVDKNNSTTMTINSDESSLSRPSDVNSSIPKNNLSYLVNKKFLVNFYINKFNVKVKHLISGNGRLEAINSAYTIYFMLENIHQEYSKIEAGGSDVTLKTLIEELDTTITEAHETLDVHRGFKKILLKILSVVKTLFCGTSLLENVQYVSFFKTNSNKNLEQVKKDVVLDKNPIPSNSK